MPWRGNNFYGIPIRLTPREADRRFDFAESQENKRGRVVRNLQKERARLHEERAAKVTEMDRLVARTARLEGEIRALDILVGRVNGEIAVELAK